jgi:hypothetical protein
MQREFGKNASIAAFMFMFNRHDATAPEEIRGPGRAICVFPLAAPMPRPAEHLAAMADIACGKHGSPLVAPICGG